MNTPSHKGKEGVSDTEPKHNTRQFLTFNVGQEEYGVDIMTVREIKGWTEVRKLPNSPEFLRGVMDLRGLIVPIFDLRSCFKLGMTTAGVQHVIIILAVAGHTLGLLVDAVSDIITVGNMQINAPPDSGNHVDSAIIHGLISLETHMVVLLNVECLFSMEHVENATRQAA